MPCKERAPAHSADILLCDFATTCLFTPGESMTEKVTTPYYASPQVHEGLYSEGVDVWSCGVVMYLLLTGYPRRAKALAEFQNMRSDDFRRALTKGKCLLNLPIQERGDHISQHAHKLLDMLIMTSEEHRATPRQAMKNSWLKDHAPQHAVTTPREELNRARAMPGECSLSLWSRGRSCRKCVAEDIEVECLFYCLARVPSGFERVSVIVGPDATRVMFIDRSPACRGSMPDMKLGMTLSLSCLSYAFTWPCEEMCCVRKSSVELPDGSLLEFHDQGHNLNKQTVLTIMQAAVRLSDGRTWRISIDLNMSSALNTSPVQEGTTMRQCSRLTR
eukprot:g13711.t1